MSEAIKQRDGITFYFDVNIKIKQKGTIFVADVPQLKIATQGRTYEEATTAAHDAIGLFLTTCAEMKTLGTVLKQALNEDGLKILGQNNLTN